MVDTMVTAQAAMARFWPFLGPAFFVSVGYMDPGNWATAIEGGSRFGYELVWVLVLSNVVALFLQTLAARLGLVTGKHLAQVCREEYPGATSFFLWFLCELSIVAQDLTMVLGTAIGLDLLLHFPMLSSVFLMAADAVLYLVILPLLGVRKAEMISVGVVGLVLLCFLLHIIIGSAPLASVFSGMLPRLRRDSLYTIVSLLGANIMPHNLYLHSSLLQGQRKRWSGSLDVLCRYNFLDIAVAFGAALVVNLVVLMVSATTFHNAGLVVLTLQDAHALMEQILNSTVAPAVFGLALVCSGQLSAFTGTIAGQVALEGFLQTNMHGWLHRFLIRITAIFPAAICVWRTGSAGAYRLLIFSQVFLALQLPFTVVPLIKVTSSDAHMGERRNSMVVKSLAWVTVGLLFFLDIWLVSDMLFGESDDWIYFASWEILANLDWTALAWSEMWQVGLFFAILLAVCLSMGFLVWMVVTPLQVDSQELRRRLWLEEYELMKESSDAKGDQEYTDEKAAAIEKSSPSVQEHREHEQNVILSCQSAVPHAEGHRLEDPGNVCQEVEQGVQGSDVLFDKAVTEVESPKRLSSVSCDNSLAGEQISSPNALSSPGLSLSAGPLCDPREVSLGKRSGVQDRKEDDISASALKKAEAEADAEVGIDADMLDFHDDDADGWETLEHDETVISGLPGSFSSVAYEGPGSGRSVGGRSDTSEGSGGGSGSGSLSRLSGLGRAARKQFAAILDEFWSKLFDYHGLQVSPSIVRNLGGGTGPKQRHNNGYERTDTQSASPRQSKDSWQQHNFSDQLGRMDAYLRAHSHSAASTSSRFGLSPDFLSRASASQSRNERPYSSMRLPAYHDEYDDFYQPATIHGYQTPSFVSRSSPRASPARPMHLDVTRRSVQRESSFSHMARPLESQGIDYSGVTSAQVDMMRSSFDKPAKSGWVGDSLSSRSSVSSHPADRVLSQTERHLGPSDSSCYDPSQWDPIVHRATGRWDPLVYRATGELDMAHRYNLSTQPTEGVRTAKFSSAPISRGELSSEAPLVFDEISPSETGKDRFFGQSAPSLENQSLWSGQPFEQLFGTSERSNHSRTQAQGRAGPSSLSSSSVTGDIGGREFEIEMLGNFRVCIIKLLGLEGSDWLFRPDNGSDEDLVAAIACHERLARNSEAFEPYSRMYSNNSDQQHWQAHGRSLGAPGKHSSKSLSGQKSVPHCGDECVWGKGLLISFGVWCVRRILELSLMESRPELWGKYTYVLNRLQGILEPALRPRLVPPPCLCIQQYSPAFPSRNGYHGSSGQSYPHPWPWGRNSSNSAKGKGASATIFLEMIKEVEAAVGSRKGRTGTAAGDVAFPKGKENLASVLKRYKRHLANKPPGALAQGAGQVNSGGGRRGGAGGSAPAIFFAASVCVCTVLLFPAT